MTDTPTQETDRFDELAEAPANDILLKFGRLAYRADGKGDVEPTAELLWVAKAIANAIRTEVERIGEAAAFHEHNWQNERDLKVELRDSLIAAEAERDEWRDRYEAAVLLEAQAKAERDELRVALTNIKRLCQHNQTPLAHKTLALTDAALTKSEGKQDG